MTSPEASSRAQAPPWPATALKFSIGVIAIGLVGFSAVAWLAIARQGTSTIPAIFPSASMHGMEMMPMGAALFIGMWVTMMVAMMFPSVAPMVVMHWRMSKSRNQSSLSVPVFVLGYLGAWATLGLVALGIYRLILIATPSLSSRTAGIAAGVVLVGAGAYQLSKFKSVCLKHCRGPLQFLFHWKPGLKGAALMGLEHGAFCVGCCWGLMAVMFVVGLMNLVWMGAIAVVIFVEKITPFGEKMSRAVGAGLIGLGVIAGLYPIFMIG